MIGPAYIHVPDGRRRLRIVALCRSYSRQIVRIGGAHVPSKLSTICGFAKVELRPNRHQSAEVFIPPQTTPNYWLAVRVFSQQGPDWCQSAIRASSPLRVPEMALAFDDRASGPVWTGSDPSLELSIVYNDDRVPAVLAAV
jgi:hypothetical protein